MKVYEHYDLSSILWYKLGGTVKYLLEVATEEDVKEALRFLTEKNITNVFILGTGSNLIFAKEFFYGAVIHFVDSAYTKPQRIGKTTIQAFAGTLLDDVIQFGFSQNLTGLEWAGGLPGTVGAAVRGNVGAFGGEIKDVVTSVTILEMRGQSTGIQTVTTQDLQFAYRTSLIKQHKNLIVISAEFTLKEATDEGLEEAKGVYESNKQYRETNHPLDYPNCGSVFKNIHDKAQVEKILEFWPEVREQVEGRWHGKVSMGYIIKKLGFSGYQVGNAQVSEKHSNFIINKGGAKAADVLQIIATIQKKVHETFGFTPEVEVEVVR